MAIRPMEALRRIARAGDELEGDNRADLVAMSELAAEALDGALQMQIDHPIADQVKAVRRELALRLTVYRKRVTERKMKQADADREIAVMQAVHDTLMDVAEKLGTPIEEKKT